MPLEWLLAKWTAVNHIVSGSFERRITVPAVTEVWRPQAAHSHVNFLPESSQPVSPAQAEHTKPSGQRFSKRCLAHAAPSGTCLATPARERRSCFQRLTM